MQKTLGAIWRRTFAFSLMVAITMTTFGVAQLNVNAQQKDPGYDPQPPVENPVTYQPDAAAVAFSNTTPINIADRVSSTSPPGLGNPYPSNINVTGLTGTITDVNVTLRGVTHTFPDDIDILLVSPTGKALILQSDAGGGTAVTNRTYTFDQQAATQISTSVLPAEGTSVQPGNHAGNDTTDVFPAPAPQTGYLNPGPQTGGTAGNLSSFNGDAPNGTWSLYVVDDEPIDEGSISGGWTIDITSAGTGCTYTINPTSASIAAAGGTGSFTVTSQAGCTFTAVSNSPFITITSGGTGTGSGTVNFTVAANTGAARTGTITVAGQTFTVNQAGVTTAPAKPCFDFFGTGRTSFATFFRPPAADPQTNIVWRLQSNGGTGSETVFYGSKTTDFVTPGYYDNDNRADVSVWRPGTTANTAAFYYTRPSTAPTTIQGVQWGRSDATTAATNDTPTYEADYDGDGRDDYTVVRNVNNVWNWFYLRSSNNTVGGVAFGNATSGVADVRMAGADYTGDGRAEIAVIRLNATGKDSYLIGDSVTGTLVMAQAWGEFNTDFYIIGDFLGDTRADFAVWRGFGATSTGEWHIRENGGTTQIIGYKWGIGGSDVAVCGDYNGDGKSDMAVWRPSNRTFYWANSPGNTTSGVQVFGNAGDSPIGQLRTY